MKIQLKINGEWAVLPPDFLLKMMKTSPLFSDQGDFSYPFELPVEPNRHIFGPIADPMGFVRLREFHALPAEIWFEGNQVFVGQTEVSGEQTFSKRGKVSFNVVSNNGAFKDMISGLNCRDVKLKDEIKLGWRPSRLTWPGLNVEYKGRFLKPGLSYDNVREDYTGTSDKDVQQYVDLERTIRIDLENKLEMLFPELVFNELPVNVTDEYPKAAYCNVRLCCPQTKSESESESANGGYGYKLYEPDGENRAPSFYVLYFLDCLFGEKTLDLCYDNEEVLCVQDLCRLAFLNVYPGFDDKEEHEIKLSQMLKQTDEGNLYSSFYANVSLNVYCTCVNISYNNKRGWAFVEDYISLIKTGNYSWEENSTPYGYNCYLNGDNFPDTNVSDVVSDLTNGFGIIFDYDQQNNFMKLHLVRDIMKNTEVDTPLCTILKEPTITRTDKNGQILSFGNSDDLNYNYAMPKGKYRDGSDDPIVVNNFLELSSMKRDKTDAHTYYDISTGAAYRLRVDESTGNEPQFFKVGTYRDYKIGIAKEMTYRQHLVFDEKENEFDTSDTKVRIDRDESNSDKTELKFSPVTVNDVWSWYYNQGPGSPNGQPLDANNDKFSFPKSASDQMLCVFVDSEAFNNHISVAECSIDVIKGITTNYSRRHTVLGYENAKVLDMTTMTESSDGTGVPVKIVATGTLTIAGENAFDITNDQHPLASANVGYQLGIMRGPGNKSDVEIGYNYDDEGNDTWYNVVNSPTFTADSIDPYGNVFDYNGTEAGGASLEGRLSLLLDARKVKEYDKDGNPVYFEVTDNTVARRGLVPQLLEDFLYFKAHHVKVTFPVLMSLSAINNLQLLKWNRFGDYVGLIKQVNYELTESGLRNVTVELLVANK